MLSSYEDMLLKIAVQNDFSVDKAEMNIPRELLTAGPGGPCTPGRPVGGGAGVVLGRALGPYGGISNPFGQPFLESYSVPFSNSANNYT